jgi:hypothetical protein
MKTYGKNKSVPKWGSAATYTTSIADSPEENCRWGVESHSEKTGNTHKANKRPNGLQDRGCASLSDDSNRQNEQKINNKNGKRSRDICLTEVVKESDPNHCRCLLDSINRFKEKPNETAGTLFIRVPNIWTVENQTVYINWLKKLGFKDGFLGEADGFKYPKEEVTKHLNYLIIKIVLLNIQ